MKVSQQKKHNTKGTLEENRVKLVSSDAPDLF